MLVVFLPSGNSDARCISNGENDNRSVKSRGAQLEMCAPQVRDGIYRKLIPNGTGFSGIDCKDVPQHVCYEANPQDNNKTLYIIDPCGENIPILVDNNPDRIETVKHYVDPVTGDNYVTYWFDPPLEPIE
jgi:hypothetical protein